MNAFLTGVVDADDDEGLEQAGGDQVGGGLSDPPVLTPLKGRLGVEQVLPVVHVQDGKMAAGLSVITRGQPHQDIAVAGQEGRVELFVPVERGVLRMHRPRDQYMFQVLGC